MTSSITLNEEKHDDGRSGLAVNKILIPSYNRSISSSAYNTVSCLTGGRKHNDYGVQYSTSRWQHRDRWY
jgi:hypothetical protein